jgi:hypothetical protein
MNCLLDKIELNMGFTFSQGIHVNKNKKKINIESLK